MTTAPEAFAVRAFANPNARCVGVLGGPGSGKTRTLREFVLLPGFASLAFDPAGELADLLSKEEEVDVLPLSREWQNVRVGGVPWLPWIVGRIRDGGKIVLDMRRARRDAVQIVDMVLQAMDDGSVRDVILVMEECQRYLGQSNGQISYEALAAVELGRNWAWGRVLATQRPASVQKEALERADSLLLGRLQGVNDANAVDGLLALNMDDARERAAVLRRMRDLAPGEFLLREPSNPPTVNQ